ncbi:MAG: hypothetical protein WCG98_02395 [bacterium]
MPTDPEDTREVVRVLVVEISVDLAEVKAVLTLEILISEILCEVSLAEDLVEAEEKQKLAETTSQLVSTSRLRRLFSVPKKDLRMKECTK